MMTPERYKEAREGEQRSRRGKFLLIGVIVLAVFAALLGYYLGIGRYVEAPALVGMAESQALKEAKSEGFDITFKERRFSETAPLGTIISTDPGAGDKVLPQATIKAVVSKGKERYKVPKLNGMTIDEAKAALDNESVHLKLGTQTPKFDENIKEGEIVGTELKAGTELKRGEAVDVFVSKGRKPINVTNFTGKPEQEAVNGLSALGFKVSINRSFSDTVKKGVVVSQTPKDGTKFKNDVIALQISKGPELVPVPDVIGQTASAATKALKAKGFEVERLGPGNFTVRATNPGPGKKARSGSTVTITFLPF